MWFRGLEAVVQWDKKDSHDRWNFPFVQINLLNIVISVIKSFKAFWIGLYLDIIWLILTVDVGRLTEVLREGFWIWKWNI